jgi:hypothetical protein
LWLNVHSGKDNSAEERKREREVIGSSLIGDLDSHKNGLRGEH